MRGLTGKINNLNNDPRSRAILELKLAIKPYTPEQKLWFAVIEQAVWDMGKKIPRGSHYFFKRKQPLAWICDNLNIDPSVIFRVLKKCEVL
jgi:hypothetical protein